MKKSVKLSSHGGLHLGFQISQAESSTTPTTLSPRSDARDTATRSPTHRSLPLQSTRDIRQRSAATETQLQNTSASKYFKVIR